MIDVSKFKLLVSDVDGTLLNSRHELTPETVDAFHRLQENGILTTIATGKIYPSIADLVEPLVGEAPLVLGHGAIIQDKAQNVLLSQGLPHQVSEMVFEASEKYHCDLAVYLPDSILATQYNRNMEMLTEYWEPRAREIGKWSSLNEEISQIVKILFVSRESEIKLNQIEAEMSQTLKGKAAVQRSIPHVIEVTNLLATKDRALDFLEQYLNISKSEMIAVGDGENDVSMLKAAGMGIAVANAVPALKEIADLVIGSNDENGVAGAILSWLPG